MALAQTHLVQRKKRPLFQRQDSNKNPRLAGVWRRPRGLHNKLRLHRKGHETVVSIGYRSARVARGLHKSGLMIVSVRHASDLLHLNAQQHCVVFSSTLGARKRLSLYAVAQERHLKVLGIKDIPAALARLTKLKSAASSKPASPSSAVASGKAPSVAPVAVDKKTTEKKTTKPRASKKPREVSA